MNYLPKRLAFFGRKPSGWHRWLGSACRDSYNRKDAFPCLRGVPLTFKALRNKDYSEVPKTLGEHLKKHRRELGLLQREAGECMGVTKETVANWEKDKTRPVPSQFKPVVAFLGYDPTPAPTSLAEGVEAKQRSLGATLGQVAQYLGWDEGSLRRYLKGNWQLSAERAAALEQFLSLATEAAASVLAQPRR